MFVFIYAETQLFSNLLPSFFDNLTLFLIHKSKNSVSIFIYIICSTLSIIFQSFGFLIMCILYGWFGFDFHWISDGQSPDERCVFFKIEFIIVYLSSSGMYFRKYIFTFRYRLVEKYWPYLFGFGLPYGILAKFSSFFVGLL